MKAIYILMCTLLGGALLLSSLPQQDFTIEKIPVDVLDFSISKIPEDVLNRMEGKSIPKGGLPYSTEELRYLKVLHVTSEGETKHGELIVNKAIAEDVLEIFRTLYEKRYPIESIRLIDDFNADDERSMQANNSSGFCYRKVAGSKTLSKHSRGLAVDINPLYNPCFRYAKDKNGRLTKQIRQLQPANAQPYIDRSKPFKYKIQPNDLAVKLFKAKGFRWGGDWRRSKDYQHFELP